MQQPFLRTARCALTPPPGFLLFFFFDNRIRFYLKKIFPTLRMGNIIILQGVRTMHSSTMDGLKMEKINKRITNSDGIDIM